MTPSSSFKKLFKDGKDASKGQETANEYAYKDRILEVVKAIKEEIEKVMKDIKNSGFRNQ